MLNVLKQIVMYKQLNSMGKQKINLWFNWLYEIILGVRLYILANGLISPLVGPLIKVNKKSYDNNRF